MKNGHGPSLEIVSRQGRPVLRVLVKSRRVVWDPNKFDTTHLELPLSQATMQRLDDEYFKVVSE